MTGRLFVLHSPSKDEEVKFTRYLGVVLLPGVLLLEPGVEELLPGVVELLLPGVELLLEDLPELPMLLPLGLVPRREEPDCDPLMPGEPTALLLEEPKEPL